jgi:hypothetical protein
MTTDAAVFLMSTARFSERRVWHETWVWLCLKFFAELFFNPTRIQQDIIINIYKESCKISVFWPLLASACLSVRMEQLGPNRHKYLCTVMIIPRWIFLIMKNVSEKVVEKIKTYFIFNNFSENHVVYGIMWNKYGRTRQATDENIIWRMLFACRITKATDTHSEYGILIAFYGNNL